MEPFDPLVAANVRYASSQHRPAAVRPRRELAVVTCMDARIDPARAFGIELGDAHVLRTAGGRVTDDVLRSLTLSVHLLGVRAVAVIAHTDCGLRDPDGTLVERLTQAAGIPPEPRDWGTFADPADAVRSDCSALAEWPQRPERLNLAGYVLDVADGRLREIVAPHTVTATSSASR